MRAEPCDWAAGAQGVTTMMGVSLRARRHTTQVMLGLSLRARRHTTQVMLGLSLRARHHRRTGEHPFGGSNRVLPEWRTQLVCHAAPPGRKNNNELTQCLFLTVVDEPMNVSFVTPPEMYLR